MVLWVLYPIRHCLSGVTEWAIVCLYWIAVPTPKEKFQSVKGFTKRERVRERIQSVLTET
jgi:hypothetical protein